MNKEKEKEILEKVKLLTKHKKVTFLKHAKEQATERGLTHLDVMDILLNPKSIKFNERNKGSFDKNATYKIIGGKNDHRVAVYVQEKSIIVITVMDNPLLEKQRLERLDRK